MLRKECKLNALYSVVSLYDCALVTPIKGYLTTWSSVAA